MRHPHSTLCPLARPDASKKEAKLTGSTATHIEEPLTNARVAAFVRALSDCASALDCQDTICHRLNPTRSVRSRTTDRIPDLRKAGFDPIGPVTIFGSLSLDCDGGSRLSICRLHMSSPSSRWRTTRPGLREDVNVCYADCNT